MLGRAVLGAAESFIVTGAFSWGLALAGPQNTGKTMAWVGTAMYAAFAIMSNNIEGKVVVITGASRDWARRPPGFCARMAQALY